VDEHPGKGTVINIDDTSARRPGGGGVPILGACCYNDGTCDDLTEGDCTDAGGNWQGPDTTCGDDPNPCVGACCEGEDGTTCVENSTPDSCAADGGTFQDFGSTCDPNPCVPCAPAAGITLQNIYSGFFFESQSGTRLGIHYATLSGRMHWDATSHILVSGNCFVDSHMAGDVTINSNASGCSGSGTATQSVIPSGSDCGTGSCGNGSETCISGAASFPLYTSGCTNNGVTRCLPCGLDIYFNAWKSTGSITTNTATQLITEYHPNSVTAPNTAAGSLFIEWNWSDPCLTSRAAANHWPFAIQPLKLFAKQGDTGLGDIIERAIGPLGGNAFKAWYETTFRRKCGCSKRKQHWNRRYPLKP
jgi:hypothetical protein